MAKKPTGKNTSGRGQRDLTVKVKTARGRTLSSTRWLQRQLNDPYVKRAQAEGYRGRAAFKILEIDDKFRFLVPGARVVDLGCAPGGWCQVAVKRCNVLGEKSGKARGTILGIDLQDKLSARYLQRQVLIDSLTVENRRFRESTESGAAAKDSLITALQVEVSLDEATDALGEQAHAAGAEVATIRAAAIMKRASQRQNAHEI